MFVFQLFAVLVICPLIHGYVEDFNDPSSIQCTGMYGGGPDQSNIASIRIHFQQFTPPVRFTALIYNSLDEAALRNDMGWTVQCGDDRTLLDGECNQSDIGKFILRNISLGSPILNVVRYANTSDVPEDIVYPIEKTGYYCVALVPKRMALNGSESFNAQVTFKNSFGLMPAADYPKLIVSQ